MRTAGHRSALPAGAQARLNNVCASLGSIPQDRPAAGAPAAAAPRARRSMRTRTGARRTARHGGGRGRRHGGAAELARPTPPPRCCRWGPAAPGSLSGRNLPVFNSMQAAASGLSAEVGRRWRGERRARHARFRVERPQRGEPHHHGEGRRLRRTPSPSTRGRRNESGCACSIVPMFRYELLTTDGQSLGTGTVSKLDAYLETARSSAWSASCRRPRFPTR